MSVINTMLRKLDERGAAAPAIGVAAAAPRRKASPGWRLPAIVALGGIAVAATAFADWPAALGLAGTARAPQVLQAVQASAAVAAVPPPAVLPAASATAPAAETARVAPPSAAPSSGARLAAEASPAQPAAAPMVPELAPPMPPRIDKRSVEPKPAQRAAALHRSALEAAQTGHASQALATALEALAADASHAPSRLLAAMLQHEAGATDRAIALLREGLARNPADTAPQALLLARLQAAADDGTGALATLDQYRLGDAAAAGLRAALHARSGDWPRAQDAYEAAARQEPANAAWWFGLGVALDAQSDGARARQAYARAQSIGLAREEQARYADQRLRALD